jgi:hypothetical protein
MCCKACGRFGRMLASGIPLISQKTGCAHAGSHGCTGLQNATRTTCNSVRAWQVSPVAKATSRWLLGLHHSKVDLLYDACCRPARSLHKLNTDKATADVQGTCRRVCRNPDQTKCQTLTSQLSTGGSDILSTTNHDLMDGKQWDVVSIKALNIRRF